MSSCGMLPNKHSRVEILSSTDMKDHLLVNFHTTRAFVEMVPMDQHSHHTAPLLPQPGRHPQRTILLRKQMNKRSGHSLLPTPPRHPVLASAGLSSPFPDQPDVAFNGDVWFDHSDRAEEAPSSH
ncbi:hypothetical protein BLNAU_19612 [Blattamonas nauphoetae]|uniref:Uncharacterized protein n=1 Tax=Blattamonas nauphoetae TaxID=2049346 RepID=A0ABQ9X1L3_9EUKA|nr:hypothetical protein BLNAU_19612 [Blattamonas nauphoetae]